MVGGRLGSPGARRRPEVRLLLPGEIAPVNGWGTFDGRGDVLQPTSGQWAWPGALRAGVAGGIRYPLWTNSAASFPGGRYSGRGYRGPGIPFYGVWAGGGWVAPSDTASRALPGVSAGAVAVGAHRGWRYGLATDGVDFFDMRYRGYGPGSVYDMPWLPQAQGYGWPGARRWRAPVGCALLTIHTVQGRYQFEVGLPSRSPSAGRELEGAILARLAVGREVVLPGLDGRALHMVPNPNVDDITVAACQGR